MIVILINDINGFESNQQNPNINITNPTINKYIKFNAFEIDC